MDEPRPSSRRRIAAALVGALIFCAGAVVVFLSQPPAGFPAGATLEVPKGATLSETADALAARGLIRSAELFKAYVALIGRSTAAVKSGDYLFAAPESAPRIADRLVQGIEGFPVVKTTIPEGTDSTRIAAIVAKQIPSFDAAAFMREAAPFEGYLFPDTYFWPTNATPERVIADMRADFAARLAASSVQAALASSSRSESDVIKMASIVEKEATSSADRRLVAGILWKRLDAGMALDVDPPFAYILDKPLSDLTLDDLKTPSPYNLYLHAGLPPTPIDNPGLDAIMDTLRPTSSRYWYYLSGTDGNMHYATTLQGHALNKDRYLN